MKIMLDAGHGYSTIGKRTPDGMKEYEFNRTVANHMRDLLAQYEGVTVFFAHEDGRDVPLWERCKKANALKVDLYFSIHANAYGSGWNDANGIETFAWIRNNAEPLRLSNAVQANLVKATGLRNRGVKTADFQVLRDTHMPAILVEHAFMTNNSEAEKLKSDAFRQTCAAANVQAIASVYGLKAKAVTVVAANEGWKQQSGKWFYYKNGALVKNDWALDSKKKWYYLGETGEMVTNQWVRWKNKWYYMLADGQMATGEITVKGKPYILRDNGILIMTDKDGEVIE